MGQMLMVCVVEGEEEEAEQKQTDDLTSIRATSHLPFPFLLVRLRLTASLVGKWYDAIYNCG